MKWLVIISTFLISTPFAQAENWPFALLYNQVHAGRTCGDVTNADLHAAGFKCAYGGIPVEQLSVSSWEMFEWNAVQLAAPRQVQKNKCLAESIQVLRDDKNIRNTWYSELAKSWIGLKKAKMMSDRCEFEIQRRMTSEDVEKNQMHEAYERDLKSIDAQLKGIKPLAKEWQDVCFNQSNLYALRMSQQLFQYSLPLISDPDFFDELEEHRDMLINKETGKPLTDAEILKMDLSDNEHSLGNISLNLNKRFKKEVERSLKTMQNDRKEKVQDIENSKLRGNYDLSSGLRTYIFNDGTMMEILAGKGLLDEDYNDLGHSKAPGEQPSIPRGTLYSAKRIAEEEKRKVVTNGAFCILARYEMTAGGELTEIGAEMVLTAGLINPVFRSLQAAKALRLAKAVSDAPVESIDWLVGKDKIVGIVNDPHVAADFDKASKATIAEKAIGRGAQYMQAFAMIARSCEKSMGGKKVRSVLNGDFDARSQGADLPISIGFQTWDIDIDPKLRPDCTDVDDKNLMVSTDPRNNSNCIYNAVTLLAPFKVSLPIVLVGGLPH